MKGQRRACPSLIDRNLLGKLRVQTKLPVGPSHPEGWCWRVPLGCPDGGFLITVRNHPKSPGVSPPLPVKLIPGPLHLPGPTAAHEAREYWCSAEAVAYRGDASCLVGKLTMFDTCQLHGPLSEARKARLQGRAWRLMLRNTRQEGLTCGALL